MDCQQIQEMLDAYALGVGDPSETKSVEEHVADCVRCWDELSAAQQTAALLALAVPVEQVPSRVEQRVMITAERERSPIPVRKEPKGGFLGRLRNPWPATAGAFGAVSLAALAVTAFLAMQVNDVQDENKHLQTRMEETSQELQQQVELTTSQRDTQRVIFTVLADDSRQAVEVEPESRSVTADAYYTWSSQAQTGLLFCQNLPQLPAGKVYQLWFTARGKAYNLQPFVSADGTCQVTMDLSFLQESPSGIGISVENAPGGSQRPTGGWLLYAHLD